MEQIRDSAGGLKGDNLVDILLLVHGTFTFLSISHKICNLPGAQGRGEGCPQGAAHAEGERAKLFSAIDVAECLLTIGIKKAKFYMNYYPYMWETVLSDYPSKQRASLLLALDALITSSFYFPSKLSRRLLRWTSGNCRSRLPVKIITKKLIWDWAFNILLATGIGAVVVAATDEIGEDRAKFAAVSCGARILGGLLVYILSRKNPRSTSQFQDGSKTLMPLASYTVQSALFSEFTNMAARSDLPVQTNFSQFHQTRITFNHKPHQLCAVCNHAPPHLTASGFQISGALAVIRLVSKGYMDYLSYGSGDVSYFFGFHEEVPHPIIPTFLMGYFVGNFIDDLLDITEHMLQTFFWRIERKCCPPPPLPNYRVRLSRISRPQ